MKHTPGPWHFTKPKLGALSWIEAKDRIGSEAIACLDSAQNIEADARLIAAAPEMLAALKNIVASAPITGLPLGLEKDIQSACAVIEKAESGTYV